MAGRPGARPRVDAVMKDGLEGVDPELADPSLRGAPLNVRKANAKNAGGDR